ncbi:unnamed protein product [Kuraishia capsulata CBS 1993]|uniref:Protein FMP42 n=1 Tax=Kuraishia capsulata CBS 1993 TaxID=1382522 RepID=W6MXG8_9ASCO|nr:uncharacterized protein KUCA_T00004850001 [Kuraishia capsulata CBS 1993]CDK28865.1 unnamed protein product [Kuraishia capsulata CBS 1993]
MPDPDQFYGQETQETSPLLPVVSRQSSYRSVVIEQHSVSKSRKLVQIACSIAWCLVAAGPVFGFAALKPVLIAQGVYHERCAPDSGNGVCVEQDLKLNFLFTLAAVVTNAAALLVGNILDRYGPRVCGTIGSILIFGASLLLRAGSDISLFDGYLVGYSGLALGGPFVFISCFHLANSFPNNSGSVLALLTGAFDSSSALFLGYRMAFQKFPELTLKRFFTYYLVVPVFIFVCQMTVMPRYTYKTAAAEVVKPGESLDPDNAYLQARSDAQLRRNSMKSVTSEVEQIRNMDKSGGVYGVLHGASVKNQMLSSWFFLMALFTTIQMIRINYFVATVRSQEEFLFDAETAVTINRFFDLALPVGGILSIPFIGLLLDNFSTLTVVEILLSISMTIGVSGIVPFKPVAYLGIALLVLYRPFYYTAVSDICAKVFGFETFGTVYGAIICFSGLCNLLQTLLDGLTHTVFHMNPIPVNVLLVSLTGIFGGLMVWFVKSEGTKSSVSTAE